MELTMATAAEPDPTEPVRMRSGEERAETLLRVLKLRSIQFIVTHKHFQRFSDIVDDDELALAVLHLVSDLRQSERRRLDCRGYLPVI